MYAKSRLISAAIFSAAVLGCVPVQAQDRVSSEGQRCTDFVTTVINVPAFVSE
jgi:hypothetical protein